MKAKKKVNYEIKTWERLTDEQREEIKRLYKSHKDVPCNPKRANSLCLLRDGKVISVLSYKIGDRFILSGGGKAIHISGMATSKSNHEGREFYRRFRESPMDRLFFILLATRARRNNVKYLGGTFLKDGKLFLKRQLRKKVIQTSRRLEAYREFRILAYKKPSVKRVKRPR